MKSRFLLDVVVGKSSTIFELFSSKDQSLLVRWDSFLVLDLGLDVFNSIRRFDFKSNGLASKGLDKDLHLIVSNYFYIVLGIFTSKTAAISLPFDFVGGKKGCWRQVGGGKNSITVALRVTLLKDSDAMTIRCRSTLQ